MDTFTMRFVAALWNHANGICLYPEGRNYQWRMQGAISKALQDLGFNNAQIREILALSNHCQVPSEYSNEDVMTGEWTVRVCMCLRDIVKRAEKMHTSAPSPLTPSGT